MPWWPTTVGVYVTLQVVVAVDPARVQLLDGPKVPVELVAKVTVPVGGVGLAFVSVTLAVHVVGVLSSTDAGEQLTLVVVLCTFTPTGRLNVPLLPVCTLSPP